MRTHGIRLHGSGFPQDSHRCVEVRLESGTNRERDVAEARQDGDLDVPVEHLALEVLKQDGHELVRVLRALVAQCAADIADEANRDSAKLCVLVCLESGI
jgi:hypothetical protein